MLGDGDPHPHPNVSSGGALVISLDFELHWGIRDHTPLAGETEERMRATRDVVPELLARFEADGVAATWATVGFLFAAGRDAMASHEPAVKPSYPVAALDPYAQEVGADEAADPAHYAPSLIRRILATPRQEIGTHTFSHYFCLDDAAGASAFDADLASAVAIATSLGVELRSIVFPRNQVVEPYLELLPKHGIRNYRGNARLGGPGEGGGPVAARLHRGLRFADAYLPVSGAQTVPWSDIVERPGLRNVRASMFLRAHYRREPFLGALHLQRLVSGMRRAAARDEVFHLWWHPHNFASRPEQCFAVLEAVMDEYRRLRDAYGMRSLTMDEAADVAESR